MKEKRQAKYLEHSPKRKGSPLWIVVSVLVVVALGAAWFLLSGQSPETAAASGDENVRQESTMKLASIDTAYGPVQVGEAYLGSIRHEEVDYGEVVMEVFNMIYETDEWFLFSICYGDAQEGNCIGKIRAEGKEIPVSVVSGSYTQDNFPDAEALKTYYELMDQLDVILSSIRANENFVATGSQTEIETAKQKQQMTYWTVELPESMTWEENIVNGVGHVDFFGTIGEERIHLYTVTLGDTDADSILGMYQTENGKVSVGIKTYHGDSQNIWEDDVHAQEYGFMMETINDVIQAIISDAKFSEN